MMWGHPIRDLFSPALGIVAGGAVTVGAFLKAALGKFDYATPPGADYEGSTRAVFNVMLFAPLLVALLWITPNNANFLLAMCVCSGIASFLFRQLYIKAKAGRIYEVPVPRKGQRIRAIFRLSVTKYEQLVGGDRLISAAAAEKARLGCTDAELLKRAGYNPAELWEDSDRAMVQIRFERWYFAYIFLAVMTLVIGSLSLQAVLSGESPRDSAVKIWMKSHPAPHP